MSQLRSALAAHTEVPGLVALVAKRGEVEVVALGTTQEHGAVRVERDSIFRIASMSKPVTAAATMVLVDDGVISLDTPVEAWLPELANRRVLKRHDSELDDTVPAERVPTVRDLLTFTWGFGIPLAPPETLPIQRALDQLKLCQKIPMPSDYAPPDEWVRQLATLPLMHQPGARWMYNTGSDVLGVVVARATKQPFETFLQERIFAPLGMTDTAFSCPPARRARFTASYVVDRDRLKLYDPIDGEWSKPPPFPSGAAGLVSTVDDLHAFGAMLLARGGKILSEQSATLMMSDQLTAAQRAASNDFVNLFVDHSWGFGGEVVIGNDPSGSPGSYGWDGGLGSAFRVDPARQMVTVLLSNRSFVSPEPPAVVKDFWRAAA
jgi:CubicO group peptidase (beta-lactamase class C family)